MKRKYLLFSLLLTGSSLYAQEWPAVHPETRPATRWWWLGSAVDATNLTWWLLPARLSLWRGRTPMPPHHVICFSLSLSS